ncbi:hypothetical protein CRG98_030130, partial [Punica granatum]
MKLNAETLHIHHERVLLQTRKPNLSSLSRRDQLPTVQRVQWSSLSNKAALGFPIRLSSTTSALDIRRCFLSKCNSQDTLDSFEQNPDQEFSQESFQVSVQGKQAPILKILKESNSFLPHVVLASTLLAIFYPPSFTWFTN